MTLSDNLPTTQASMATPEEEGQEDHEKRVGTEVRGKRKVRV
jgi:hypothetical protein